MAKATTKSKQNKYFLLLLLSMFPFFALTDAAAGKNLLNCFVHRQR